MQNNAVIKCDVIDVYLLTLKMFILLNDNVMVLK